MDEYRTNHLYHSRRINGHFDHIFDQGNDQAHTISKISKESNEIKTGTRNRHNQMCLLRINL